MTYLKKQNLRSFTTHKFSKTNYVLFYNYSRSRRLNELRKLLFYKYSMRTDLLN